MPPKGPNNPASRRSRLWSMTWNNPPPDARDVAQRLVDAGILTYVIAGNEGGDGTPHLQMFVIAAYVMYYSTIRSYFPGIYAAETYPHATPEQNIAYCQKEGDWWEVGTRPTTTEEANGRQKTKWAEVVENAKAGRISEIDEGVLLRYYNAIRHMGATSATSEDDLEQVCGVWIHGPPDTGKSFIVRETFGTPNIHLKQLSKWWDGYRGQIAVLLDEVSPEFAWQYRSELKTWADRYAFNSEFKGGSMTIRPRYIIVTSNWSIDEIYASRSFDTVDKNAFKKRFIEVEIPTRGHMTPAELRETAEYRTLPSRIVAPRLFGGKRGRSVNPPSLSSSSPDPRFVMQAPSDCSDTDAPEWVDRRSGSQSPNH